ncbi:bifunctional glycosyltransferase family 2/GtrA family protein [Pseudarthrobacter sp. efr-133-R2A-89]|uniref:bifunctional glycosyltransferase family 2/GtrA family protein n=1 Tax=Pseudarthrobacter sp. efr-133-R2A-89 TaxID=3040302 RepID=UPI002554815C|nr:bifunctional glycosyltransferase family 2/GtrA family protein [Pseudarthrobacter sp. efr-133-R2A-89]
MTLTDSTSGTLPDAAVAPVGIPSRGRAGRRAPVDTRTTAPVLDVTIPVFNEERDLEECLRRLHAHLLDSFPHAFRITVADNASTDGTLKIAERLAREFPELAVVHLDEKGRGNALRKVWLASPSPVLAYMDVDLSTDLAALAPLLAPLISGHSDLAIGTRLTRNSRVVRGPEREFISRGYNLMLHSFMGARFSDAQCGFKAIRADVAQQILPYTVDNSWFFDTELLVLAERCGLRVHEVPVDWIDDPDSSVDVLRTALADVRGMARLTRDLLYGRIPVPELRAALARGPLPASSRAAEQTRGGSLFGQLVRFAAIGAASTLAYLAIFVFCRGFMDPQLANFLALLITAVANTGANRRFTFGIQGGNPVRHHFEGLIVFGIGLLLTSGALALVHRTTTPDRWAEILTVVAANLAATAVRFLLFRLWVFRERTPRTAPTAHPGPGPGPGQGTASTGTPAASSADDTTATASTETAAS